MSCAQSINTGARARHGLKLPAGNEGAGTVVATSRYQTRHFASARYDTGVLRNDTTVSYKATAVFRSTNGGRSWSPPGLVTGQGQQSGCWVRLSDGTILLPFGHKDAVSLERTAPPF